MLSKTTRLEKEPRDKPPADEKIVLVIGATGLPGDFLPSALIEEKTASFLRLVCFSHHLNVDKPADMTRIRKNLIDLGLWKGYVLERLEILVKTWR